MTTDRRSTARWMRAASLLLVAPLACATEAAPRVIEVAGSDYAFTVSDTLPAGPARVHFVGRGAVPHEMLLARLREGVTHAEFADSLLNDRPTRPLREGGSAVLFSVPGQRDFPLAVGVNLVAGRRYAIWCQFQDSVGRPKHLAMGMLKLLTVR